MTQTLTTQTLTTQTLTKDATPIQTTFRPTGGHGYLEVHWTDLHALSLTGQVSGSSYQQNDRVYLEEDADAPLFTRAAAAAGRTVREKTAAQSGAFLAKATPYSPDWRPYVAVQDRDRLRFTTPVPLQNGQHIHEAVVELIPPGRGKVNVSEVYLRLDTGAPVRLPIKALKTYSFEVVWRRPEGLKVFSPEVRQAAGRPVVTVVNVSADGQTRESDDVLVHEAHTYARGLGPCALRFRHDGDIEVFPLSSVPDTEQLARWCGEDWAPVMVQMTPTRFGWGRPGEEPYLAFADENGLAVDAPVFNRMFARFAAPSAETRPDYSVAGSAVVLVGVGIDEHGSAVLAPFAPDAPMPEGIYTRT